MHLFSKTVTKRKCKLNSLIVIYAQIGQLARSCLGFFLSSVHKTFPHLIKFNNVNIKKTFLSIGVNVFANSYNI